MEPTRHALKTYTRKELDGIVKDLEDGLPNGRVIALFSDARVHFRAQAIYGSAIESEFVWCYGALGITKGRNNIYTFNGTVAGRDAFSYVTRINEWRALPFSSDMGEQVIAGFRERAPQGAKGASGDVIITPFYRG